ncbi:uncharacterized protein DNG_01147 [Cephalotrichum gorgonifer]|uniref:UBA domain-containing protein n=1 Tax=Cephalotrichum gorgonifer TaxID=2041049 RepID=A0AAE8SRE8_9PEZI|nr:uncharacterized protein DNG_01147 [Cephalotrichum gorgonifer]
MVMRDPTPEEVRGFLEFAGLSEDDGPLAVRALKQGNYDVNQLVMEYYDNAEAFRAKYSWDESAFTADRDGMVSEGTGTSFHIESQPEQSGLQVLHGVSPGQDTTYYGQTAPSRPPTRTKNRSPTGVHNSFDGLYNSNTAGQNALDDEDEDLKRALMESANEAGLDAPPPQTSGVISDYQNTPAFGPATREQYDTDQWAMVRQDTPQGTGSNNVRPSARKRDPKTPVLLLNDSFSMEQRLGSILTILNEIPLARNTLLRLGESAPSYGHDGEWWTGKRIMPQHVIDEGSIVDEGVVLEEEIHRLLGFLESTERSFGSTRVLSDIFSNSWDQEESFFSTLLEKYGQEVMGPMTHVARSFEIGYPDTEHQAEDCEAGNVCYFKFNLTEDSHGNKKSLYDVLDYEIWKQALEDYLYSSLETQSMSLFTSMGDVFIMNVVDSSRSTCKFEIPQTWYPERYLWSRKNEAIGIQWLRRRVRAATNRIQEKLAPSGEASLADRLKMLEMEIRRCDILLDYLNARPRFRTLEQSGFDGKMYPKGVSDVPWNPTEEDQASVDDITRTREDAKQQCESLRAEIQELESKMKRYEESERFVGRLFTGPDRERPEALTCKQYSLRGIGTSKDVVYVCRRSETLLIDLGDATPEPRDQWWRLEYSASNRQQPVQAEKLDFDAIQERVSTESNSITLIFATEDALNAPRVPLSDSLNRFVKADNRAFQRELEQEEASANEPEHDLHAFQMRSRAGSIDSMATNRASLGSADGVGEEFVHEIHPDQLPDSDSHMEMNIEPPLPEYSEVSLGVGRDGGVGPPLGAEADTNAAAREMTEVSVQPIFMSAQGRPPPLPERK